MAYNDKNKKFDLSDYVLKSSIPPCANGADTIPEYTTDAFYSNFENCYQKLKPVGIANRKDFLQCIGFNDAYTETEVSVPMNNMKKEVKESSFFADILEFIKEYFVYIIITISIIIAGLIVSGKMSSEKNE